MLIKLALLMVLICAPAVAQAVRFQSATVEGQRAVKLGVGLNRYVVIAGVAYGENALVMVAGHRHALDTCWGALMITKTRVVYGGSSSAHDFSFPRADLINLEIKNGQVLHVKTKGKEFNFFPWAESVAYNNSGDFPIVLNWYGLAISDFDRAWKQFEDTYNAGLARDNLTLPAQPIAILDNYDRFKDRTYYATSPMPISPDGGVVLKAAFSSEGAAPKVPKDMVLFLDTDESVQRAFRSGNREMIFLVDGERLRLGKMEWLDSAYLPGTRYTSGRVVESLGIVVPWESFRRISAGQSVEFQAGSVEAKLSPVQLEALQKLVAKAEGK